jgi:hypothetical protein
MRAVADSHEMKSVRMVCGSCLFFFGNLQAAISAAEGVRPRGNG